MHSAVARLSDLYTPIAEDLRAVQRLFDEELRCDLPFIDALCGHLQHYRGKMIRPALMLLVARACGRMTREHVTLAAVVEMVHMATLVHDDVLDEARLRRQRPTFNAMSGNETAVLLGDYLISHAYHLCSSLDSQYAARTIASCTNTVCEGELLQVSHRGDWDLTVETYLTIISRKTAALTSVACMLGAKYAGGDARVIRAMASYGMDVGVAFQVVDDVLDLTGSEDQTGKTLGTDAFAGKLTLPIIHFLQAARNGDRGALQAACADPSPEGRRRLAGLLGESIDVALDLARTRVQSAVASLQLLPRSPAQESLSAMAEFIVRRRC